MIRSWFAAVLSLFVLLGAVLLPRPLPARADVQPAAGQFVPVTPVRVVEGYGLKTKTSYALSPLGKGGVPAAGVTAVVFQFSATGTATGWLSVYASDLALPATSNLNYAAGVTATNQVVTGLGTDGTATVYNGGGSTVALDFDVVGYYTAAGSVAGSTFVPVAPARILSAEPVVKNKTVTVSPLGTGGIPATNVTAVLAHVSLNASVAGTVTVYPTGTAKPGTVDVRFGTDGSYTNLVVATLGGDGTFLVHSTQAAKVTVDVAGYYQAPGGTAAGSTFVPLAPTRFIPGVTVPANSTTEYPLAGVGGVPASGVAAVVFNVTANQATTAGALSTWALGTAKPVARQLSYHAGDSWPTLQVSRLGTGGKISLYNSGEAVRLLGDIVGYYKAASAPGVPTAVSALADSAAAMVSWNAPAGDGGAAVTKYTVTAAPGGKTAVASGDSTNVRVPGLTNGTAYTFSVTATNAAGTSASSQSSAAVTPEAPAAAGQPFVTDVVSRDGAAQVTWSPPPAGADTVVSYLLKATPGGSTAEAAGDLTQAILPGLTNGTAYTITVTARNANGSGKPSEPSVTVVPEPAQLPLRPAVTSVLALNGRIDLQWVAPPDGGGVITGYTVTSSPGGKVVKVAAGTTVASITGLANGTPTALTITASNSAGTGPAAEVSATPAASRAPAAPGDLRVSATGAGQLTAAWSAPADIGTGAVTGYTVTASPGGATATVGATATSAVLSGLSQTTAYTVTVKATSAAGTGAASPASDPVTPKVTMKATPVVLTSASAATLQRAQQDGTLHFRTPTAQVSALKTGDLLVMSPNPVKPQGFYARVTSATTRSGLFVVTTAEAAFSEMFTAGAFSWDGQLTSTDIESFTPAVAGARLAEPQTGGPDKDVGIRGGSLVLEYSFAPQQDARGASNRVEMQAAITPKFEMDFDGLTPTRLDMSAAVEVQVQSKIGYAADLELPPLKLGRLRTTCITVPVGVVPVVMCPEFDIQLHTTLSAGGGYSVSLAFDKTFAVSLRNTAGNWSASAALTSEKAPEQTVNFFAEAGLEVELEVPATMYFYGVVGPEVTIVPTVEAFADTTQDPWWEVRAGLKVGASVKSKKLFGRGVDFSKDDLINKFVTVLKAGGPYSGIKITPQDAKTSANVPIDLNVAVVGWPATIPIEWSVTKGAGSIDGSGVFTSTLKGAAEVTAKSPQAPGRPPMEATVMVLVGSSAPAAPRNVTATSSAFSALVKWSPPASSNGAPILGYTITTFPPTGTTTAPADATSAQVTHLEVGTSYLIYVRARNEAGSGPAGSPDGDVQPLDDSFLPFGSAPANIAAADPNLTTAHWGEPVLSHDGRYVVYVVDPASPLAPIDLVGASSGGYLVRQDLVTNERVLVSRGRDGVTPVTAGMPAIDSSGSVVSYLAGGSATRKVLVHDLDRGTVTDATPKDPDVIAQRQEITADGTTLVIYGQQAGTLRGSLWHRVIASGKESRVSRCWSAYACEAGPYVWEGRRFAISGDGRYVVYVEDAASGGYLANMLYDNATGAWKEMTPQSTDADGYEVSTISADASATGGWLGAYNTSTGTYTVGAYIRGGRAGTPTTANIVRSFTIGLLVAVPQLSEDGRVALIYHQSTQSDGNDGFSVYSPERSTDIAVPAQWGAMSGDGRVVAVLREDAPGVWLQRVS